MGSNLNIVEYKFCHYNYYFDTLHSSNLNIVEYKLLKALAKTDTSRK